MLEITIVISDICICIFLKEINVRNSAQIKCYTHATILCVLIPMKKLPLLDFMKSCTVYQGQCAMYTVCPYQIFALGDFRSNPIKDARLLQ